MKIGNHLTSISQLCYQIGNDLLQFALCQTSNVTDDDFRLLLNLSGQIRCYRITLCFAFDHWSSDITCRNHQRLNRKSNIWSNDCRKAMHRTSWLMLFHLVKNQELEQRFILSSNRRSKNISKHRIYE